jgi:hypothetical protein
MLIIVSNISWGAVSHGALLRGLERAKFEKRITRFHYGIPCMLSFKRGIDPPSDLYISPFKDGEGREVHFAKNCVLWFIRAVRPSLLSVLIR